MLKWGYGRIRLVSPRESSCKPIIGGNDLFGVYFWKQLPPTRIIHRLSSIVRRVIRPSFEPEVRIPALVINLWRFWYFRNLKHLRYLSPYLSPEKELFLPSFRETNRRSVPSIINHQFHHSFRDFSKKSYFNSANTMNHSPTLNLQSSIYNPQFPIRLPILPSDVIISACSRMFRSATAPA